MGEIAADVLLSLVLTFFFVKDGERFAASFLRLIPLNHKVDARELGTRTWATLSGYIRGTAVNGLVNGSLMTLGLIVIAMTPSPPAAVTAAAVLGFGFSFPWSSIATTVLRQTPERERGSALGVLSAFYDLFVGISSFAAGAVAKSFGYSAAFAMAAATPARPISPMPRAPNSFRLVSGNSTK